MLIVNVYLISHDKRFCHNKFQGCMLICRNAEGLNGQRNVGNPWYKQNVEANESIIVMKDFTLETKPELARV